MTVQNIWPLFLLIFIPAIIILYLLKQKVENKPFSSTLLWQEIYKNLEAKTPFEKLKHNILMYLQLLLMLLLIFALMAPMLKKGGAKTENIVLVMDESASMDYLYDGEESRLEEGIRRAKKQIDGLSEDAVVTLVSCGSEANVVYQGSDKITVKKRLEGLKATLDAGNLNQAAAVVNSLISDMENVEIICYTDSDFDSDAFVKNNKETALSVENLYSEGENCHVDYVNYSVEENGVTALCKVTNDGKETVTQDVSLYANSEIVDIKKVTVAASQSEVVYFDAQSIATDGSVVLRAELSKKDSLSADNEQKVCVTQSTEKKVLLLSEGNVFMEKALSLDENVTVYKSDDVSVLEQSEDVYDLYVFDGLVPTDDFDMTKMPEQAGYLFINCDKDFSALGYINKSGVVTDSVLTFTKSDITDYVEDYSFGITKAFYYNIPDWGTPFLKTAEGESVGYYGIDGLHKIAVLGFDIHNTDLALQTEFPIFMSQLTEQLLELEQAGEEIINFPVLEESKVDPVDSVTINGTKTKKKTGGRAIRNIILMLVLLLLVIEWIIYIKQVNTSKKKQFFVVRMLLFLIVILAISGISVSKKQQKTETVFLVDVSDSMAGNLEQIEDYIHQNIKELPEKNLCGVVAFGKDSAVDQFMSDKQIFSEFTVNPVTTATNIEKAIQSAISLFDEGVSKRLVLLTDGSENEGNMGLTATALKGSDIELNVIALEDSVGGNEEVYIDGLTAPNVVHVGDHYNITVSVVSNVETNAVLSLYSGRNLKGQEDIHLNKGNNSFVFEDTGVNGSLADYKAVIEPEKDTILLNNSYVTFAQIQTKPRILLVEGKAGEGAEFEKVLTAANIDYDVVSPKGAPVTVSEINQYKAVITLNVYYDDLRGGFVKALESFVKDFAGGYVCIGGDSSYALGNYKDTVLEEILPVNMDLQGEKEIPKMAMAMVIDQSGSMSSPSEDNTSLTGLDLAKQAALSGVSELRETDEIGVLAFDDKYNWTIPIRTASDIEAIKESIETIGYGGGTSIYPAVNEAYEKIIKSDAKIKHIILLTDGQDEYNQYDDLIKKINDAGITVSTVAVGEGSDQTTLSMLAEECGGRFYYTDVNNSIPRIFAQEVYLSTNTYMINEEFYPTITSNNAVTEGIFEDGSPAIYGYVATTPKQTADVILESDKGDPILSTWQYGLGRTIAWNSDGNNEWTAEYASWDNYPLLWSNIMNYIMSDTDLGEDDIEIEKEGNVATITYDTKDYDKETSVNAVITDENGESHEVTLDVTKPGSFATTIDLEEVGVYSVSIRKQAGEEVVKSYNTAYANQYSAEYQFTDGQTDLDTFVKQAGGNIKTLEDDIWENKQNMVKARVSLTIPLLILSVLLLFFDILIRRFSIDVWYHLKRIGNWLKQLLLSVFRPVVERIQKVRNKKTIEITQKVEQPLKDTENEQVTSIQENTKSKKKIKEKGKTDKKHKAEANQSQTLDMNELLRKKRDRE